MGQSIPFACQDWANAKGAYLFLSNDRVNEADILAGHFQSTRDRAGAAEGLIFVLHDTTEFTFQREDSSAIGITKSVNSGRNKPGDGLPRVRLWLESQLPCWTPAVR